MSELLIFCGESLIRSFFAKNKRFAQKTDEQIPSPDHALHVNISVLVVLYHALHVNISGLVVLYHGLNVNISFLAA